MKKALVITGGYINFNKININFSLFDIIIAADSGYVSADKLGIKANIFVGDFDSAKKPCTTAELITLPKEKDDSDTMYACKLATERGANEILIIGGTGGRADHFLSNVFLLETFKDKDISVTLLDGENKISVLKDESVTLVKENKYFSLFPLTDCIVTLSGCKYPLKDFKLNRENPSFALSNEITDNYATVTVCGKAIFCQSN